MPEVKEKTKKAQQTGEKPKKQHRRIVTGTVVSDKMDKTIVVRVDRRFKHKFYGKYVTRSKRFQAHDEKSEAKMGDIVRLVESRPLSRKKRWAFQSVVRRSNQEILQKI